MFNTNTNADNVTDKIMSNNKPRKNQAVTDYWFDKSRTLRKSIILYKQQGGMATPVIYLTKPRWISDEEFMETFNNMKIYISQGGNNEY